MSDESSTVADDATTVAARIIVTGRVHMVGFRAFVVKNAPPNLSGTVHNLQDGTVECIAEGSRADIENLIACIKEGPPASRVDRVDVTWETPSGDYTNMRGI